MGALQPTDERVGDYLLLLSGPRKFCARLCDIIAVKELGSVLKAWPKPEEYSRSPTWRVSGSQGILELVVVVVQTPVVDSPADFRQAKNNFWFKSSSRILPPANSTNRFSPGLPLAMNSVFTSDRSRLHRTSFSTNRKEVLQNSRHVLGRKSTCHFDRQTIASGLVDHDE